MTNRDLAEKIYEDLNKRGADLGNASIGIIRKTLGDNGVKNRSIPDVVGRSLTLFKDEIYKFRDEKLEGWDEPYHYNAEGWATMLEFIQWLNAR